MLARNPAVQLLWGGLVLLGVFWACGVITRAYAGSLDLSGVRDVATLRTPELTVLARVLSTIGGGYVVFPLAAASAAVLCLRRRLSSASLIVVSTFGAVVIENLDKLLVDRPRPPVRHLAFVSSPSFPSGHATQSAAFYASLLLLGCVALRQDVRHARLVRTGAATVVLTLVCAIAFSRVYLGVHYPTDVAAGLTLGACWAGFVFSRVVGHPRMLQGRG